MAARYFAVASRQANRTQARHMRPIARSGRDTVWWDEGADFCIKGLGEKRHWVPLGSLIWLAAEARSTGTLGWLCSRRMPCQSARKRWVSPFAWAWLGCAALPPR